MKVKSKAELRLEIKRLKEENQSLLRLPTGPERCPFTGRKFWGNIEHEDLGVIATYGGPFDTYTIPQRADDDPDYYCYRFDQDGGYWVDGCESIGKAVVDDQLYTSEEDPQELLAVAKMLADWLNRGGWDGGGPDVEADKERMRKVFACWEAE